MLDLLLNFLFPPICGICGKKDNNWICDECYNKLKINIIYQKEFHKYYDESVYFFIYKDIRNIILKYKFGNESYLSNTFLNIFLKNKKFCRNLKFYDIIIPVPMHIKKKKKRGYNQTELITNKLAKKLGINTSLDVLYKIKNTKTQSTLSEKERFVNVLDAFGIKNTELIKNKNIILFDDIITTGATVNECSKILKENGAKKVVVLSIAKD